MLRRHLNGKIRVWSPKQVRNFAVLPSTYIKFENLGILDCIPPHLDFEMRFGKRPAFL